MVIIVLLNVAFTCATPEAMFLRSRRRTRVASLPILDPLAARRCDRRANDWCSDHAADLAQGYGNSRCALLTGDGFGRPLTGAGIGMGALAADRQSATVPQPAVAAEVHQPLDIHGDFAPQVPFDHIVAVDDL